MKLLVVGTPEDVTGFALAGVDGVTCTSREEAAQAIANADADTLVFVSAELAVPRSSSECLGVPRLKSSPPRNPEEPEEPEELPSLHVLNTNAVTLPARM